MLARPLKKAPLRVSCGQNAQFIHGQTLVYLEPPNGSPYVGAPHHLTRAFLAVQRQSRINRP